MNYKKLLHIGPGGLGCPCCSDAPGSDGRYMAFRKAKKQEKKLAMKESELEISESKED